jgi:CheY-like chemotaxis protein
MFRPYRVALLGFSTFERGALASYFRLAVRRTPSYELVTEPDEADFIVADADHDATVSLVAVLERNDQTMFIGTAAPPGATAWMKRPIDPLHVLRELDAMVLMQAAATPPVPLPMSGDGHPAHGMRTVAQPVRRVREPHSLLSPFGPSPPSAPAPARPAASAPTAMRAPAVTAPSPPAALLVDDSEIALHYLRGRLERFGLAVECTHTSDQAIERLAHRGFELVFIDVELGTDSQLDGLALCQHIKRVHHPAVGGPSSVVMVSAHHSELDRVRGTLAGCDAYLGKPLDEPELARVLQRHGLKPLATAG